MKEESKNDKKNVIIKIILIIIIILLLLHNCYLMEKKGKKSEKTLTGNVDVFEISCDDCEDDSKEETALGNINLSEETENLSDSTTNSAFNSNIKKRNNVSKSTNTNKSSSTTEKENNNANIDNNNQSSSSDNNINNDNNNNDNNDNEDDNLLKDFSVADKTITWSSSNNLRIFTNPTYDMEEKISPESGNIYEFVIKNNTNKNVKYLINFKEKNDYNINMKYKLKKGNTYVISDYVSYNELNQSNIVLNSNENDKYYLEWKWVSSDNDTSIGSNPNSAYSLSIEIKAESISE